MNHASEDHVTIDRAHTETTLYRVAICAFTYYPDKPHAEPGYTVEEDVTWCAAPLHNLPIEPLAELRARIRTLITDPEADRRAFIADLSDLAGE